MRPSLTRSCRGLAVACAAAALAITARPVAAQTLLLTGTAVEDFAWSASTSRLYAVLPAGTGGPESSVAELHPATGAIVTRIAIPDGPGGGATQLAVSDDGSTLFVGIDGGRSVRRYGLPAFTPGPSFGFGLDAYQIAITALDLAVVPGATNTVAVSQAGQFTARELVVYDNGVARPDRVFGSGLRFFSPTQLIEPTFGYRYRVVATGLVPDAAATEFLRSGISAIEQGIAYQNGGQVYDLVSRQVLGTCPSRGLALPATNLDRILYFDSGQVEACAPSTYTVTGRLPLALIAGFTSGVRTGAGRYALTDYQRRLVIAEGFDGPLPPPPGPPQGYPWSVGYEPAIEATLGGCTTCRAGDLFTLHAGVRNLFGRSFEVKAAIVLPNGAAIGATALGISHLVLRNLYADGSAPLLQVILPPGLPPGRWAAELALIDPDSGVVATRSTVSFEVLP